MTDNVLPLSGLRVLDFSRLLPGPYCTRILADLGARVIKVEDTREGDLLRYVPPFLEGTGSTFALLNRKKRSVAINLKAPAGQAVAQDLAGRSDVIVEGFRPGVAARLGIDFETLARRNHRLVYCSISGYGQEGANRDLPGHDLGYAAIAGLLDALFPGGPRVPGVQLVDAAAALVAALRILAALRAAEAAPQFLDVSLATAAQALMPGAVADVVADPRPGPRFLDLLRGSERNDLYRCADDRWLAVTPVEEPFWERLCAALRDIGALGRNETPTSERLHQIFRAHTSSAWFALLSEADVPCAPVRSLPEAMERPPAAPFITADGNQDDVPLLGQHTVACLEELGYSAEQIDALAEQGAVRI